MKSTAFSLILVIALCILGSCQSSVNPNSGANIVGKSADNNCKLLSYTIEYPAFTAQFAFEYDDNQNLIGSKKLINNELERALNYTYNQEGLVSGIKKYFEGVLLEKVELSWRADSVIILTTKLKGEEWVEGSQINLHFNANHEVERVEDFIKDSIGNLKHYGSGYVNVWDNNNLIKVSNWIFSTDTLGDIKKADEMARQKATLVSDRGFQYNDILYYDNKEVELYGEVVFNYDDKKNPIREMQIANAVLPNDFNSSINNPIKAVTTYGTGEKIEYSAEYTYNEQNYPEKGAVNIQYISADGDSAQVTYNVTYEYQGCE